MLARLLASLLNRHHVVDRLAESRLIRQAAQITASALTKAQITGRVPANLGEVGSLLRRTRQMIVNELKEGFKEGSRQTKK